jgi:hypothetical protein
VEFSFDLKFGDVDKSDAASGGSISVASKWDARFKEFLSGSLGHAWLVVGIQESLDEHGTRSWDGIVAWGFEPCLVDGIDLIALIWIPTGADEWSTQGVPVAENNFSHDACGRLNWWQVAQLSTLNVEVVANVFADGARVGRSTWSLSVNSLVKWFQFIGTFIAHKHRLYLTILIIWLILTFEDLPSAARRIPPSYLIEMIVVY